MEHRFDPIQRAEAVWTQFSPAISRTLLAYERDAELRRDLAQEVYLAILASIVRVEAAENPKAYVLRIVHNVATDHVARESRHVWVALDDNIAGSAVDSEQAIDAADERDRLLEAVRRLRLPYRQVITLVLEGFAHTEIAHLLGITEGSVRVRYLRARSQLKELLSHD